MNSKIVLVGLALGGVTFGITRLIGGSPAGSERYLMPILAVYLLVGLVLFWRTTHRRPNTIDQTSTTMVNQDLADVQKKQPLSWYGVSFLIGVGVILLLDLVFR